MSVKGALDVRRLLPVLVGVLLGVSVGLAVSLLVAGTRRAEAAVLISSPAGTGAVRPELPNLRELATSAVVVGNIRSTLRLAQSMQEIRAHLRATVRPKTEVIGLSASDTDAEHARQIAQEAVVVFAQVVEARFGGAKPELHAAVFDPAHVLGGPERHFLRNGFGGGLIGLLIGSSVVFVLAGNRRETGALGIRPQDDRKLKMRESVLAQRVKLVADRERRLAARAGELAVREQQLELSERPGVEEGEYGARETEAREVAGTERAEEPPATALAPSPPGPPAPSSTPLAAPLAPAPEESEATQIVSAVRERRASFTLEDLERLIANQATAPPERREEWRAYLFYLREHAAPDGSLPANFEGLIAEVFWDAGL